MRGPNSLRRPHAFAVAASLRWPLLAVLLICAVGAGSVALGPDDNWDLLYYHLYAPYAYLHGRYLHDIGPAQSQGFLNPVADLLFYGLISSALNEAPRVVAFVMGAVHGINAVLILAIARQVLRPAAAWERWTLCGAALLMGVSGAGFVSLLGATTNDLINSIFVLASLLCLLRAAAPAGDDDGLRRGFAWAGLWAGVGVGLKYTAAIYLPGLALVALTAALRRRSVGGALAFAAAALLGLLAVAGHHLLTLWHDFGNPLFPWLNDIFRSPWYEPQALRDVRFVPRDAGQLLAYPFYWAKTNAYLVTEMPFRDWRCAIAYVAIVAAVPALIAPRAFDRLRGARVCTDVRGLGLVVLFVVVSFVCWELAFGIYRYGAALEMLTGVVTMGALLRLIGDSRLRVAAGIGVLAVAAATTVYLDWGRGDYDDRVVDVRVPPLPPNSVVLIATWQPAAYFIPFAEPSARFVGIENNYLELSQTNRLATEVKRIMRAPGPAKFVLNVGAFDRAKTDGLLAHFGLKLGAQPCEPIESNLATADDEALSLCPIGE